MEKVVENHNKPEFGRKWGKVCFVLSAKQVASKLDELKKTGNPLSWVAWQLALLCVGWAYVFGARGEYCNPANRRARKYEEHPTIRTACKNFDGAGSCSGCKWLPGGERTRFFDCRGFTYWVLLMVFGWKLMGTGATTQWDNASNWSAKGEVADGIPQGVIVCLFYYKKDSKGNRTKTLSHTGLYYNGETVECSNGVQHSKTLNKKWEVWAVPACVGASPTPQPEPIPEPTPDTKPTLRRGATGAFVTLAQTMLTQKGYDCGTIDGDYGTATIAAVKAFQRDHTDSDGNPLAVDGVVGQKTWCALEHAEATVFYTVTISHLSKSQAAALCSQYPGATMVEGG